MAVKRVSATVGVLSRLFFIVWGIFWFIFSLTCSAGHGMALFHNALPLIIKECICKAHLPDAMLCYAMATLMFYGWVFFPFLFFSQC